MCAVFWSDGWIDAPLLPFDTPITVCDGCTCIFWLDEAEVLGTIAQSGPRVNPEWMFARPVRNLIHDEYHDAIHSACWRDRDHELLLRHLTWQSVNGPFRDREHPRLVELVDDDIENVDALRRLLRLTADLDRLLLVDIARQRGEFDEAERLLAVKMSEEYSDVARQMRRWVEKGDRRLLPFRWGEESATTSGTD